VKRTRLNVLLTALLGLAILVMLNYVASRHYWRWDWTSNELFTLSEQSQRMLEDLEQDVTVYVFLSQGEQDFADVQTLLEQYLAHTDRITVEWVDPDREPSRYKILAEKLGIDSWSPGPYTLATVPIVVTSGGRKWKIERHQLISENFDSFDDPDGSKLDLQSERALTGAILEVTTGTPTVVCLAQGHGEWELGAAGPRSFSAVVRELQWEKIKVEAFELREGQPVPESCHALFVVGPQRPYAEAEVQIVDDFIASGGHVLLAFDPVIKKEELLASGFEQTLAQRGIQLNADIVIETDPTQLLPDSPGDIFFATALGTHRVTDKIRQRGGGVFLASARSVDATEGGDAEVLIHTSPLARAETDLQRAVAKGQEPAEENKPVPLAVAWEYVPPLEELDARKAGTEPEGPKPGRLLVMGDADWLSSELLENPGFANVDLLSSVAGWLTQRDALIDIPPRKAKARPFIMSDKDLENLFVRVVVLLPLAALIAGFGVWWARRS
jgi:ABC-type uncharacterized transport system involved in gliding motility auxiliary subunit